MNTFSKPELVVPAGDWASLNTAIEAGADSVYFGIKGINMRHSAKNFDLLEMKKIMAGLHGSGKKGYLALNVIVYDNEMDKVLSILEKAREADVDAVILWDLSVLSLARKMGLEIHLSTQAGVSNFRALGIYADMGVRRAVMARELDLKNISGIKTKLKEKRIDCGLEVFIHGAMCVSISGRCFLSLHTFNRSANRGQCLQPCRREYYIKDTDGESEYVIGKDYLLSPRDLCTVGFIDKLIEAGIDAFKIEGRMRPPEYVKVVTGVYRTAIDEYFRGELTGGRKKELSDKLRYSFNRGFDSGFYFGSPGEMGGEITREYEKTYLGEVKKYYGKIGVCELILRTAGLQKGQKILFYGQKTPAEFFIVEQMQIEHDPVEKAEKGTLVAIKVPFRVRKNDKVFLWEESKEQKISDQESRYA